MGRPCREMRHGRCVNLLKSDYGRWMGRICKEFSVSYLPIDGLAKPAMGASATFTLEWGRVFDSYVYIFSFFFSLFLFLTS
jgi:hypothetical protein